jgi:hypothetical protein
LVEILEVDDHEEYQVILIDRLAEVLDLIEVIELVEETD